jgi:hypothetical protein
MSLVRFQALPVGLERDPLSHVSIIEELLEWKAATSVYKTEINCREDPLRWPRDTSLPANVGANFADKRLPPGRYNSLADQKSQSLYFVSLQTQQNIIFQRQLQILEKMAQK